MASAEEQKKQGEEKGFAGLSSMVSDVDATVASIPKQPQRDALTSSTQQSSQASRTVSQEQPKPTQQSYQTPAQPSGGSSVGKWLFGIVAVIGVIWLANQSDNNTSSRSAYSLGTSSTSVAPAPAWQPPVTQPQAPSRPTEDKPSVGRNSVLSTAQIRYCLAEKVRLDVTESVINNYVDSDVDRFNGYVAEYNSRCGEFRYRQGALERARRDVEPFHSQLQAEGRSRFVRSPAAATRSSTPAQVPQPVRPSPDATVQAVQRRLKELRYDVGAADGLPGGKTRAAILVFQRDISLTADGVANASLLWQLELSGGAERRESSVPASQPPALSSLPRPSVAQQNTAGVSEAEKAAIEQACDGAGQYSGPSAYQSCVNRELASLQSSGGRPDLSFATSEERTAIEVLAIARVNTVAPVPTTAVCAENLAKQGIGKRKL